jgi:hypothetical protein
MRRAFLGSRHLPAGIGALLAVAWVLLHLEAPLVEDALFWWVPKGMLAAERGFLLSLHADLPSAIHVDPLALVPQWAGGIPDYGHPPLWYWWLGLTTGAHPTIRALHIATLLPAALAGAGMAALGARLGHRWSGLAVFALPPFLAQLLRPELDLPLIAAVPWALLALVDRRWNRFAVIAAIAVLVKEPGVLLTVPAVALAFRERRWRWQALVPLLTLLGWAALLGWMAKPERLPDGVSGYLVDLATVLNIVFIEQGRWLLLLGLPLLLRHRTMTVFIATWILFFAGVGFFANRGTADAFTHVRYLLPGMAVAVVVLAGRWPILSVIGLLWLHSRSPYGPEASLYGIDVARAVGSTAPWIADRQAEGTEVWVGTHAAATLTQPWAGAVDAPAEGLRIYAMSTHPGDIRDGSIVMEASYGEPTGSILTGRTKSAIVHWKEHDAYVIAWRIAEDPR